MGTITEAGSTMGAPKRVTCRDVVAAAGVSHQTVSRVLNDRPGVAKDTGLRILQTVGELRYQPSAIARSLIRQRSLTLGMVTAGLKYVGPPRTLNGVTNQAGVLDYPIAEPVGGVIHQPDAETAAINDVVLTLAGVERSGTDLQFNRPASNPGEVPSYVHIGDPPVIGADGIIYGRYETPDRAPVPAGPAGDDAAWTTGVEVPQNVKGLHILLTVESGRQRLRQRCHGHQRPTASMRET
jgi:hypothetical protein